MKDHIANIAIVIESGKRFEPSEELALENAFNSYLTEVAKREDLDAADPYLYRLGFLQDELARACFKWEIPLPTRLRQFVREFDRYDDPELRARVFKRIKEGAFCSLNNSPRVVRE
jgi:hypothetical protein